VLARAAACAARTGPRTGAHCGPSGQSPQEQRSAASQHAGSAPASAAMPAGAGAAGKSIWKGEPAGGLRASLIVPRKSSQAWPSRAPPPTYVIARSFMTGYTTSCAGRGLGAERDVKLVHGALVHDGAHHVLRAARAWALSMTNRFDPEISDATWWSKMPSLSRPATRASAVQELRMHGGRMGCLIAETLHPRMLLTLSCEQSGVRLLGRLQKSAACRINPTHLAALATRERRPLL